MRATCNHYIHTKYSELQFGISKGRHKQIKETKEIQTNKESKRKKRRVKVNKGNERC
jgi:hypothetical protein